MTTDPHGPLHGIRVLDASRVLAGPFCGQMLGDLGAEVVKVERPGAGDETRAWGPPFQGPLSAYYLSCNRNKRAITLDMSREEGRELLYALVRQSDVLLENFRAESADRLGFGAARLFKVNPRLILCSITGFGLTGPMSHSPGYDFAIQALSGLMSVTGPVEGPPYKVGVAVADVLTGLYAAVAVLACVHARVYSNHGYAIDMALLDCAVAAQVNLPQAYLTSGKEPGRQGNAHLQIVPYQLFATADNWLVVAVGNDGQWQRFCETAEHPEWATDPRFAVNTGRVKNRAVLVPMIAAMMRTRSTQAWQQQLKKSDVPHAPVWNYADLLSQPQAAAREMRVTVSDPSGKPIDLVGAPFHISGTTLPVAKAPPALGQHTVEVLTELLSLTPQQIEELRRKKMI